MTSKATPVNVSRLAKLFGCSERQVQRFASRDGMPKAKRGLYDMTACVRWRISCLQAQLSEGTQKAQDLISEKEQTRRVKAEADLKEFDLAERRGELVRLTLYRDVMAGMIAVTRQNILNLPHRIGHELVGLNEAEVRAKLRGAVEEAISALRMPELPNQESGCRSDAEDHEG